MFRMRSIDIPKAIQLAPCYGRHLQPSVLRLSGTEDLPAVTSP